MASAQPSAQTSKALGEPAAASPSPGISQPPPLIPLTVIDAPTQRIWASSIIVAAQAYKLYIFLASSSPSLSFALLIDLALVLSLSRLRVPRLNFTEARWAAIGAISAGISWTCLGGWRLLLSLIGLSSMSNWIVSSWDDFFSRPLGIAEHRVRINDLIRPGTHLLGQHTIHVLPYSTAKFAQNFPSCHCVGSGRAEVKVPVIFNNTEPQHLQYSITPFGPGAVPLLYNVTIPKAGLTNVDSGNELHNEGQNDDDWDEVEAEVMGSGSLVRRRDYQVPAQARRRNVKSQHDKDVQAIVRRRTRQPQKMFELSINAPGRVRLERVLDKTLMDARLGRSEIMVVECPSMTLVADKSQDSRKKSRLALTRGGSTEADRSQEAAVDHKCPSDGTQLTVQVHGLAPLEASYRRTWTPRAETRAKPEDEIRQISHIANPRVASPLIGVEANRVEDVLSPLLQRRSVGARDDAGSKASNFEWAAAQDEQVPISVALNQPGRYTYELEAVRDACGNEMSMDALIKAQTQKGTNRLVGDSAKSTSSHPMRQGLIKRQVIDVHSRAHATISGCSAESPLRLLRGGSKRDVVIRATNVEPGTDWHASLRFQPDSPEVNSAWSSNVSLNAEGIGRLTAEKPGTYILDGLEGSYCTGEVGSPWSCPVIEVPPPAAEISFSTIEDVCAGSVGVTAMAVLSGNPPFRLRYEIQRAGRQPVRQERTISRTREEFEFRPSTEGAVQYRFIGLSDANYHDLPLDGPVFEQIVHPLASAHFVQHGSSSRAGQNEKMVVRSCSGNKASVDVQLEGTSPYDLTYAVRTGGASGKPNQAEQKTVRGITSQKHTLDIDVTPQSTTRDELLTVSLVSIKDGKGCERPLTTADVNIEVRRVRPTAAFIVPSGGGDGRGGGKTLALEGEDVKLPVRLEGEGPWKVEYQRDGDQMPVTTTLRGPEADLVVDRAGTYRLVSVHDAFCQGTVATDSRHWTVDVKARPTVEFDPAGGSRQSKNGSLIRRSVCRGTPDSAGVLSAGHAPLQITYEHQAPTWSANDGSDALAIEDAAGRSSGRRKHETFTTAQNVTALHLATNVPGWHVYRLLELGDTSYPLMALPARASGTVLEQMVHALPSAAFSNADATGRSGSGSKAKKSYCLGDSLSSTDLGASAPNVQLTGTPPFTLEFELFNAQNPRASSRRFIRRDIHSHSVSLDPSKADGGADAKPFRFDATGRWSFRVLSLIDGNRCEAGQLGGGQDAPILAHSPAAEIEVAETASILPIGTREDYCVGDTVEYHLQGTPPWTVVYAFNGKESSATQTRQHTFSRVAEKEGVMEIRSVAHQQNKCRRDMRGAQDEVGMRKTIHPLPRARVSNTVQDLREGASAQITFQLEGTPPFALSYQRLEAVDLFAHPRVLESHTVGGIAGHEYTIEADQEGTWVVTALRDRWCKTANPSAEAVDVR